jgi:nitrite reductase (NADH) small subunit
MLAGNSPIEFGWTALIRADQIPFGQGRCVVLDARKIAVFRLRSGQVYALDAICPHRGGPLNDGLADSGAIVCPLHGYKFSLTDGCGQDNDFSIRCYPVEVRAGMVYVRS